MKYITKMINDMEQLNKISLGILINFNLLELIIPFLYFNGDFMTFSLLSNLLLNYLSLSNISNLYYYNIWESFFTNFYIYLNLSSSLMTLFIILYLNKLMIRK